MCEKEYDVVVYTLKEFFEAVNAGKNRILWIDMEIPSAVVEAYTSEVAEAYRVKRKKFVEETLARLREEGVK